MSAREEDLVLVLNAGSSSLKFALFENAAPPVQTAAGAIDRIGSGQASFTLKGPKPEQAEVRATNHVSGLEYLLERLSKTIGTSTFRAVGHRVVHGGARYREPQRVDSAMLTELRRISGFDPEHLPAEIALMETLAAKFPQIPQIACFDTAFHSAMPHVAKLLPIPRRY